VNNYMKKEDSAAQDDEIGDINSSDLIDENETIENNTTESSIISKIFKVDEERR
jgi:hypothetical protein